MTSVVQDQLTFIEGPAQRPLLSSVDDIGLVLEACFEARTRLTLLYAENLPARFFDLSSQQAGTILQKLRNYGVRLAVVLTPDTVAMSHRFGEMVTEERRGQAFGVFETRSAAIEWLAG